MLFVPTYTSDRMVDPRDPESSFSRAPTMPATPFNSLTDTSGKAVYLKFAKIGSLGLAWAAASAAAVDSVEAGAASVEATVAVVSVEAEVASVEVTAVVATLEEVATMPELVAAAAVLLHLFHQTHSPISRRLVRIGTRLSMSGM